MDTEGFLKITGRMKELIITEGGKNIAPIPIESRIKENLPSVISQAIVIGDKQKFLTCLLTLKVEIDPATSIPSEILEQSVKNWCKKILREKGIKEEGMIPHTISDFKNNRHVEIFLQGIQEGIDQANIKADFRAAKVKRFCILPNEFFTAGGEFGPTLKIRRHFIAKKYQEEIEYMYLG